jgi:hypothetical protein
MIWQPDPNQPKPQKPLNLREALPLDKRPIFDRIEESQSSGSPPTQQDISELLKNLPPHMRSLYQERINSKNNPNA